MNFILSIFVTLILTTSAIADKKASSYIFLGGHSSTILENDAMFYTLGFGWDRTLENSIYLGGIFAFNFGSIDIKDEQTNRIKSKSITGYDVDLRLGYSIDSVDIFSILGVAAQNFNNVSAYGFGYGAGALWHVNKSWDIGSEYKTHRMSPDKSLDNYDYDLFVIRLGFRW